MFLSFLRWWLPVILVMALIFGFSGDTRSMQRSSRVIGPLVKWLYPSISEPNLDRAVFLGRKIAHITEFALLACLVWRAIRKPNRLSSHWTWRAAALTLLFVAAYAATDELHQCFVPSRQGSALDVLIDVFGAVLALLVLAFLGRWRARGSNPG